MNEFENTIIYNSNSSDYLKALSEWKPISIFYGEHRCICGKKIKELCEIQNKYNDNILIVGNECIKKIIKVDMDKYFNGLSQIKNSKTPNKNFLIYCLKKNIINDWEYKFINSIRNKKKLSIKQKNIKIKIINKIFSNLNSIYGVLNHSKNKMLL